MQRVRHDSDFHFQGVTRDLRTSEGWGGRGEGGAALPTLIRANVPQRLGIPGQQIPWRLEEICGVDTADKEGWSWKLFG